MTTSIPQAIQKTVPETKIRYGGATALLTITVSLGFCERVAFNFVVADLDETPRIAVGMLLI